MGFQLEFFVSCEVFFNLLPRLPLKKENLFRPPFLDQSSVQRY